MALAVLIQAGVVLVLAAGLAVYVAAQRPRTWATGTVLGLLAAIQIWSAGAFLSFTADVGAPARALGIRAVFFGAFLLPPLWLYFTARAARVPWVEESPRATLAALFLPVSLTFVGLLTNDSHRLFATRLDDRVLTDPAPMWAGPMFWVHSFVLYAYVAVGIALCLRGALRSDDERERRLLLVLVLAAVVPGVTTALEVAGVAPAPLTLTPTGLGCTGLLLVVALVRYRLLDALPLPARDVLTHLGDGLILCDLSGRVGEANPAAERLLGRSRDRLVGAGLGALLRGLDPAGGLEPALLGEPGEAPRAAVLETDDERVIELSAGFVHGPSGAPIGRFLVLQDRTERRRYERLRLQAQRLESLGVLASGIAHEINNPLAFVRANLAHLGRLADAGFGAKGEAGAEPGATLELREVIAESVAGIDRIAAIVASTRRLSRQFPGAGGELDLNAVVEDALELSGPPAGSAIDVRTRLDRGLPAVRGSAERLGQVVGNLLTNAMQALAGREDARIVIETASGEGAAELRVHDNGPGVPPELRERVFDPFFTTRAPDEGKGLGLAIAFDVVREHGGVIQVGASPEGGACFTVRLPRAEPPASAG